MASIAQPGLLNQGPQRMPSNTPVTSAPADPMSGAYNAGNPWGFDPNKALGPGNKLPGQNYYDPSIDEKLIPEQSKQDANFYQNFLNYGQPTAGMGGSKDPMVQALQGQYADQTKDYLSGLSAESAANAPVMGQRQSLQVAQELGTEYQNAVNNYNQQLQYENQAYNLMIQNKYMQDATQAQLMNQIFGGMGSFVGSFMGAGQAGGQAGSLIGSAVGGSGATA